MVHKDTLAKRNSRITVFLFSKTLNASSFQTEPRTLLHGQSVFCAVLTYVKSTRVQKPPGRSVKGEAAAFPSIAAETHMQREVWRHHNVHPASHTYISFLTSVFQLCGALETRTRLLKAHAANATILSEFSPQARHAHTAHRDDSIHRQHCLLPFT